MPLLFEATPCYSFALLSYAEQFNAVAVHGKAMLCHRSTQQINAFPLLRYAVLG